MAARREGWESDPLSEISLDEGLISDTGVRSGFVQFLFKRLMKILSTIALTPRCSPPHPHTDDRPSFHTQTPTGKPTGPPNPASIGGTGSSPQGQLSPW
jgi:hypothetical protein